MCRLMSLLASMAALVTPCTHRSISFLSKSELQKVLSFILVTERSSENRLSMCSDLSDRLRLLPTVSSSETSASIVKECVCDLVVNVLLLVVVLVVVLVVLVVLVASLHFRKNLKTRDRRERKGKKE